MKRVFMCVLIAVMLCGCVNSKDVLEPALELRNKLQNADGCRFEAVITADYGEMIYMFKMQCTTDKTGQMQFEVKEPETISEVSGKVTGEKGVLTFEDKVLAFDTLADGYISPVSSPWVMINALKSGYITSCGETDDGNRISLNDSFSDDALQMDIWINGQGQPIRCEILYKERRCLSIDVDDFEFL